MIPTPLVSRGDNLHRSAAVTISECYRLIREIFSLGQVTLALSGYVIFRVFRVDTRNETLQETGNTRSMASLAAVCSTWISRQHSETGAIV